MNPSDLIPTVNPIPKEARRHIVQVMAEITAAVAPVPSGLILLAACESLCAAIDTYDAEARAAGRG